MSSAFLRLARHAWRIVGCLVVTLSVLPAAPALAAGDSPSGIIIGFDFNWANGPAGYSASFINNDGSTLNNCSNAAVTSGTTACNFAFSYTVTPVSGPAVPTTIAAEGSYITWPATPGGAPVCGTRQSGSTGTAPLMLWDCFNSDSFGEVFVPTTTGTLSGMSMRMTCLNPAGTPPTGLFAVLYEINGGGAEGTVSTPPVAQVAVDLSSCPTLSSWANHTFTSGDFGSVPLNFANVTLTSGTVYGVYFAGALVPGTPVAGFVAPKPVPALSGWAAIAFAVTVLGFGLWRLRRQSAA